MVKYIGLSPSKEEFNIKGESLGMSSERALYYAKSVGKHRIYRNSYPIVEPFMFDGTNVNEDLELLLFNTSIEAQRVVDEINNVYNDTFIVKEVNK